MKNKIYKWYKQGLWTAEMVANAVEKASSPPRILRRSPVRIIPVTTKSVFDYLFTEKKVSIL